MRFGLPLPSGMTPITSSVSVSMTEADSDFVLLMSSVAPVAGAAAARTRAATRIEPHVTRDSSSLSGELFDGHDGQVRGRPPQRKSYRVSDVEPLVYLRRRRAKAHGHRGHVPRDLLVRDDDDVDVRQHGAHDALGAVLARPADGRAGLGELARQSRHVAAPPEIAPADADEQREDEQDHHPPDAHQCTCAAGGATTMRSRLSASALAMSGSDSRRRVSMARR